VIGILFIIGWVCVTTGILFAILKVSPVTCDSECAARQPGLSAGAAAFALLW
jgi:hypothetical protein